MATPVIQPSFAAGEVSPSLFGRVDLAKYRTGVQTARNFFVDYRGGLSSRPGTALVGTCKAVTQALGVAPCLIPFKFNANQAYALELNQGLMRIVVDGGYVVNTLHAVTAVTNTSPLMITAPGSGYSVGQSIALDVSFSGMLRTNGVSGINGRTFIVLSVSGDTFTVGDPVGSQPIDASTWSVYAGGGQVASIYEVATPWNVVDLYALTYAQSADVLTIAHPNYPTYNIERLGQTNWQVAALAIGTALVSPSGQTATPVQGTPSSGQVLPSAAFFYAYAVTTFDYATGEESSIVGQCTCNNLALDQNIGTVNIIAWTAMPGAGSTTYYRVYKAQEVPTAAATAGPFFFGYMGQTQALSFVDMNLAPDFTTVAPLDTNPFTGGNNPGCVAYFQQRRVLAAFTLRPSSFEMSKPGNYNNFDKSYPSNAGDAISDSIVAEEVNAIGSLTPMASGLIALTADGAFQISGGAVGAAITPATIQAQPQAFSGAAPLRPLKIETDLLYLQARGSAVRDLAYNFYVNVYTGSDVSALSSHLLENRTIVQWAFAQEPFKIVWCVRDDGILLSFTYLKEQELYGWARHDTCGLVKSVCVIPEGKEDAVYIVVKRYVSGHYVYMTERLASRYFGSNTGFNIPSSTLDAWCVDAGVRQPVYKPNATVVSATPGVSGQLGTPQVIDSVPGVADGTYQALVTDPTGVGGSANIIVSGGTISAVTITAAGYGYTNPTIAFPNTSAVISATVVNPWIINTDVAVFDSTLIGATFRLYGSRGIITAVNSSTQLTVDMKVPPAGLLPNCPDTAVPPAAPGNWSLFGPISVMGGLDHLNGALVSVLADGSVQAPKVVVDGCIAIDPPAADITVGQGYTCQMQTLRFDAGEPTVQGKRKNITSLTVRVRDARGISAGPDFSSMLEIKEREYENYGDPIVLQDKGASAFNEINGLMSSTPYSYADQRININNDWTVDGVVCIEQANPLPCTILAVIPEIMVGDTN